jgi:tetratricopeptide (TPR) repeat protein
VNITQVIAEASKLARDGLLSAAADLLSEAIESDPNDVVLLRALGRVRMLQKRPGDAAELLERALRTFRGEVNEVADHGEKLPTEKPPGLAISPVIEAPRIQIPPSSDWDYLAQIEREIQAKRQYEAEGEIEQRALSKERDAGNEVIGNGSEANADVEATPAIEDLFDESADAALADLSDEIELDEEADTSFADDEAVDSVLPSPPEYEPQDDDFGDALPDELPSREELSHIPSRLTRDARARQVAVEVAERFEWDRAGVDLLTSIFVKHWWSASRSAVERALEAGATRHDIAGADTAREVWTTYPEFASFIDYSGETTHRYTVLPWPTALALIKAFPGYPDHAEIERLLVDSYEFWSESSHLTNRFDSFYKFVRYLVERAGDLNGSVPILCFSDAADSPDIPQHLSLLGELESHGIRIKEEREVFMKEAKPRGERSAARDQAFVDDIDGRTDLDME